MLPEETVCRRASDIIPTGVFRPLETLVSATYAGKGVLHSRMEKAQMQHTLFATALFALVLSACAPAAPTVDPAQVQASAVAIANTMVAVTQAAIPTPTPIPPTPLPTPAALPTPTPLPLPTLSLVAASSVPTLGASGDPCAPDAPYKPLDPGAVGPVIRNLEIDNMNKGAITISMYLNKTAFGQCGGRSFSIGGNQSINLSDMKIGCYSAAAFINGKVPSKAFGSFCIKDDTHKWDIKVYADKIVLIGP